MSPESAAQVLEPSSGPRIDTNRKELLLVVGYDGSPPSLRALDRAAELLRCRAGWLEVVFVAHAPATVSFSPQAVVELRQGLDEESATLEKQAGAFLVHQRPQWRFQRRDGAIAEQLLAAAKELQDRYGDTKAIAIVVGGPAHRYHHFIASVSASLARSGRFPVVVVP